MKRIILVILLSNLIHSQDCFVTLIDSTVKPPTEGILLDSIEVWNNPDCYKFDECHWIRTKRETTKEDYYTVRKLSIWRKN